MKPASGHVRSSFTRAGAILAVVIIWELLSRSGFVESSLFPPPTRVFLTLWMDLLGGTLVPDIVASLVRVFVGFTLGCILGCLLGLLTGMSEIANLTIGQVLQLARPVPPIAIVPLVILWIGIGETAKWFLVAFGVIFPVWMNTHAGIREVLPTYIWSARSMGASGATLIRTVYLPAATPFLFAGMRTALGIGFFCLVAAEMAGATAGVMFRVDLAHLTFRADRMLGGIMLLGVLSQCLDALLMIALRWISPWTFKFVQQGNTDGH